MVTIDDIKKRLKQEGYDERAVADGGPSLTTQLRRLIRAAGTNTQPAENMDARRREECCAWVSGRSDSFACTSMGTWLAKPG
jgi:hypothetical protein